MVKREMLENLAKTVGMECEASYSELQGLYAFTGIPTDLCEVVANNVEIFNSYRERGWEADKAAVLTLAETEYIHLECIFKNWLKRCVSADTMREVLSLCELGVDFKGKPLPPTYPGLSDAIIVAFKKWANKLVDIGFSKTAGDFDPEFNSDKWEVTMWYAISHKSEIKNAIDAYKAKS